MIWITLWRTASCHLLATDMTDFFHAVKQTSVPRSDKRSNVSGDYLKAFHHGWPRATSEWSFVFSVFGILYLEISLYEAYSESKYRLRIFPQQRWARDFAHARCLPYFTGKPQTPIRKNQIVSAYCSVRLKCSRWSSAAAAVKYGLLPVFWMQEIWNRLIFIVRYVKYTEKCNESWNGEEMG